MARRGLNTLKVERNAVRAPIWAPRGGIPIASALAWSEAPLHGEPFLITHLRGTLTPTDLLVFTHLCSRYLVEHPPEGRVGISLNEVARWQGSRRPGGSQRALAMESLARLRGATFTSVLRAKGKDSDRLVRGWGLVDEWLVYERGRDRGFVRLSAVTTQLLDEGSAVLLDAGTLDRLHRRDGLAARLWVFLEGETIGETGLTPDGQPYPVYASRPGEPPARKQRAAIADLCRLTDPRRSKTIANLRRACEAIEEEDPRYRLSIVQAAGGRQGMWNLMVTRLAHRPRLGRQSLLADGVHGPAAPAPTGAPWGMDGGTLGDARGAPSGMHVGTLGDAAPVIEAVGTAPATHDEGAPWGMEPRHPRRASPDVIPDGCLQTVAADDRRVVHGHQPSRIGSNGTDDRPTLIARDLAIVRDPEAPAWKKEAALAHLQQLGITKVDDAA